MNTTAGFANTQLTSHFKTFLIEQGKTFNEISKSCKAFLSILMSSAPKLVPQHFVRVTRLESLYLKVYSDKAVEHVYNLHAALEAGVQK